MEWSNIAVFYVYFYFVKNMNCFIFVFILYMYIGGVGINPGNLPCTTCVRPGCKRYTVGGIHRGGDLKIKKK